mmetsp:Transcript_5573/g.6259  ORF Transcript_5573/g.6259 Transcript_5573/m.6259 type:complete len:640 (-) Transcript_5573:140-2059(-)
MSAFTCDSDPNTGDSSLQAYLTIAPSGLERFVIDSISKTIQENNYECRDLRILNHGRNESRSIDYDNEEKIEEMKMKIRKQRMRRKRGRQEEKNEEKNKPMTYDNNEDSNSQICGTVTLNVGKREREMNLGYFHNETIISTPGGLEGKHLIQFKSNAPPQFISQIRPMGCGPLLALVFTSCTDGHLEDKTLELFNPKDDLEKSVSSYLSYMQNVGTSRYTNYFRDALHLWYNHVQDVWSQSSDIKDYLDTKYNINKKNIDNERNDDCVHDQLKELRDSLQRKINGTEDCKYRLSCIRSNTKDYTYSRESLIPLVADTLIPEEVTMNVSHRDDKANCPMDSKTMKCADDLKNYDFELVIFIKENLFAIAISLCPYQHLGAKSFSSGKIPPDITSPYITGEVSQQLVRLRPSISSLLLNISQVKKGDTILDPCAGVGSIPVEASLLGKSQTCFGLGGDIALSRDGCLDDVAEDYCKRARKHQMNKKCSGSCDMVCWDASSLPIRDSLVDCVISDLPFGVKCMSATKLKSFLPLLFSECARVLKQNTGRMTLLCGASFKTVLDAIEKQRNNDFVQERDGTNELFRIVAVFPTNIGGLAAWIIQAERTNCLAVRIKNHTDRFRKMTLNRKQETSRGKKKRLQS